MLKEFVLSLTSVLSSVAEDGNRPNQFNSSQVLSPIVGLWSLDLEKTSNGCEELYNFQADNHLSVVSGAEWTRGKYNIIFDDKDKTALPILFLSTHVDDNNIDCSGNQIDQSGDSFGAYMNRVSSTQFQLCADAQGNNCFMTFNKRLP